MESKPAHLRSRNPQAERERNTRELEATQTTPRDFSRPDQLAPQDKNDGLPPVDSPSPASASSITSRWKSLSRGDQDPPSLFADLPPKRKPRHREEPTTTTIRSGHRPPFFGCPRRLRRERNDPRSGEGLGQAGQHRQISVKLDLRQPAHSERSQAVLATHRPVGATRPALVAPGSRPRPRRA
jgi:hypothetical protein